MDAKTLENYAIGRTREILNEARIKNIIPLKPTAVKIVEIFTHGHEGDFTMFMQQNLGAWACCHQSYVRAAIEIPRPVIQTFATLPYEQATKCIQSIIAHEVAHVGDIRSISHDEVFRQRVEKLGYGELEDVIPRDQLRELSVLHFNIASDLLKERATEFSQISKIPFVGSVVEMYVDLLKARMEHPT
jgi:hypothetical protein